MKANALILPFIRLADRLASGLTPPRCRSCRTALFDHDNPFLCPDCLRSMAWIDDRACPRCGYPAGQYAVHTRDCQRCRDSGLRLAGTAAVVRYRGGAKHLVKCLKFGRETELASPMAGLMAARFRKAGLDGAEALLPVTLHPARRRERGFDQALLLARETGRLLNLPVLAGALRRRRDTPPQARLHRSERLANMEGSFTADPVVAGRGVALVDDVMTTGATMAECARACRQAGAKRVWALVFAR